MDVGGPPGAISRKRCFYGTLSYKFIIETYAECCFGKVHPTQIRANVETWRKLMHLIIDLSDPRYPVGRIQDADVVYDPDTPENVLHFHVPENCERMGALLYLVEK